MTGPTLVVGDVHGCADELSQLVGAVRPGRVVLVGDLFTKGPDPVGVWRQIRAGGFRAVLGNHDERLLKVVSGRRQGDAHGESVVAALNAADPTWRSWVGALPLFLEGVGPFTVVHACIRRSGSLHKTTRRMALIQRRWPSDEPRNPHWHQVYRGERRVIFGHDARRGLVRVERDGLPWVIGLDSGCVYGGKLSGYVVEEDRVVSIPAAKEYCAVGQPRAS